MSSGVGRGLSFCQIDGFAVVIFHNAYHTEVVSGHGGIENAQFEMLVFRVEEQFGIRHLLLFTVNDNGSVVGFGLFFFKQSHIVYFPGPIHSESVLAQCVVHVAGFSAGYCY